MPAVLERRVQTAYEASRYDTDSKSIRDKVRSATYRYMVEDLGLSEAEADKRAEREMAGTIGRNVCEELEQLGIKIAGKRVLDLGAGLGGLCTELAIRGAHVDGLEPGAGWFKVARERMRGFATSRVIAGVGEAIPLPDNSVDLIVSLQVLEHVQSPRKVIQEAFRVLKPGGFFYFSYENYFSFYEPHYRVFWLPLLPKVLGAAYLRMRGRNPQFLKESVTYTTFHGIRKLLAETGFECMRRQKSADALRAGSRKSMKWKVLGNMAAVNENATLNLVSAVDYTKRLLKTAVYELMRKPENS